MTAPDERGPHRQQRGIALHLAEAARRQEPDHKAEGAPHQGRYPEGCRDEQVRGDPPDESHDRTALGPADHAGGDGQQPENLGVGGPDAQVGPDGELDDDGGEDDQEGAARGAERHGDVSQSTTST
jgi:hypothetical protein